MKNKNVKWSGIAAVITGGLILSSVSAFAVPADNIVLSGTIAPVNTVAVVGVVDVYNLLDLKTTQTGLKVADVLETSNDFIGYTVTLASLNAGVGTQARLMASNIGNGHGVNYSITYGPGAGTGVTLVAGQAEVTNSNAPTSEEGTANNLRISYTGNSFLNADTYSDTITLTIAAK